MELTKEVRSKAQELNSRIIANAQIAAESIVRVGQDLKLMRDEKLYSALGYGDFEAYCKLGVKIGQRQAYNFIRCFETYGEQLTGLQHLGITKLTAMLALDSEDRDALIESGDAEQLSVRELEQRVKELQQKNEQLTLDLGEKSKEESKLEKMRNDMEKLQAELAAQKDIQTKKDERIKELEAKPVEVAVEKPSKAEIAEIEKKAAEKAKKAVKKQHDKELAELREKSESERRAAVEAEQKKYLAEIERLRKRNTDLQSSAKKAPPTSEKERIKICLEEVQRNFNTALETIGKLPEEEREKFKGVLKAVVEKMGGLLV
ncbi:MAG: DUF3102 domain-containing protein [Oscillospiraceae bacterium]|nr:DUF3102 domain-containing protein [Oscillospiraceae bacterium]